MSLNIGEIAYLNVYPFFSGFDSFNKFNFIKGEPSFLNSLLSSNKLDLAPCSSFEYLKNPDKYFLVKDISISSKDKILSVLLVLKKKIDEINNNDKIFLNYSSASSNALLKIIFWEFLKKKLDFQFFKENIFEPDKNQLLLGDTALKVYFDFFEKSKEYYIYDLATLWHKFTKLPFVFALWIINKNSINKKQYINLFIKELYNRKKSLKIPETYNSFNKKELQYYFEKIDYNLKNSHISSLKLFAELCYKYKLIENVPEFRWWNEG